MLRAYAGQHIDTSDVALELPTGSGKTLVGLLLAEWRRLHQEQRSAFVCPTNQLARQVHEKARGYGIDTVLLVGPSDQWEAAEPARFQQGKAVAITNYNHVFNRTPRIEAQTLVLDDAHTAEGPVADRWSLSLRRESLREAYFTVLNTVGGELPKHHFEALLREDLDPVHRGRVEVVLPDGVARAREQLSDVIPGLVEGTDAWYAWDALGGSLETCLVYASWSEILIRPFIAPTFTQDAFANAEQRIYLSATLGAGGELERSFGLGSIERIPQPATWDREGSGRRYMIAPGAGRDGADANRLIQEVVARIEKALLLAPGARRMGRSAAVVLPDDIPRLYAKDIEDGLDSFTDQKRAALLLANRYDGIDLPGETCRLIVLSGLPSGTHLQERFLGDPLGARHAIGERIRTRITQGVGRATRSRRDTAVVVLHGDDLIGFLNPREERAVFRSELQAELELAFSTAELPEDEVLDSVDSFLAQDENWKPSEEWLRTYAQEHPSDDPPGAELLAQAAPHEVSAWQEAWRGNYGEAANAAQRAAAALNHPSMKPYRAWWLALAASWSIVADGADAGRSAELCREADLASRQLRWRPNLGETPSKATSDQALQLRAEAAVRRLRRWHQSPRMEKALTELEEGIAETDAKKFELALERLGELLGFEAERPAKEEAAPDGAWRDGARAWILWEAKSEELAGGEVYANEVRQANSHPDWVRSHYSWPDPEQIVTLMVTPKEEVKSSATDVAGDHLFRVHPSVVIEIAEQTVAAHRQLAGEIVGLTDEEATERMAELMKGKHLDTPGLIERLAQDSLASERAGVR